MSLKSGLALWSLILVCAGALVAWNAAPFRAAEPNIRTKDLSFLPAAELAGALSFGHANSVSRLRWIDSSEPRMAQPFARRVPSTAAAASPQPRSGEERRESGAQGMAGGARRPSS